MIRQRIDTVEDAIRFLRSIDVDAIGTTCGWLLRAMDDAGAYIERPCASGRELIACARAAREDQFRERNGRNLSGPLESFIFTSRSSATPTLQKMLSERASPPMSKLTKEVKA
jgi:hypothetical protein